MHPKAHTLVKSPIPIWKQIKIEIYFIFMCIKYLIYKINQKIEI